MMRFNCIVGRWIEGPLKLLGVYFGPNLQIDNIKSDVRSKLTVSVEPDFEQKLSLLGLVDVFRVYIAPVIIYRLTNVSCHDVELYELD